MARRTNIRQRGKSWIVYFRHDGKQVFRSFKNKEEAELFLANARAQRARGEYHEHERIRFADFAQEWLRDYAVGHVREKTFQGSATNGSKSAIHSSYAEAPAPTRGG